MAHVVHLHFNPRTAGAWCCRSKKNDLVVYRRPRRFVYLLFQVRFLIQFLVKTCVRRDRVLGVLVYRIENDTAIDGVVACVKVDYALARRWVPTKQISQASIFLRVARRDAFACTDLSAQRLELEFVHILYTD